MIVKKKFTSNLLLLALFITGAIALSGYIYSHGSRVLAVSASEWQAGSIISDDIFYDNTSMSTADIQTFLNNLVPVCDTNGTQSAADLGYPNLTHAQYAAQMGWPGPPYVCMKDYYQVPRSDTIIDNFSGSIPANSLSAAQIIKNAADTYNINPKVLLVKIRLESKGPLILDTWPLQSQYTAATGYACTDSAPCDPQYAGFYNQVTNAAMQIQLYRNNPSNYRYQPFQSNTIYYNPGPCKTWASNGTCAVWYGQYQNQRDITYCGSSSVSISNYATAGLYNYTPYQPNQAALNNLYGSGDICSSYGNRNFWTFWNDWFGPSNTPFLRSWQSGKMYVRSNTDTLYYITNATQLHDLGYGTGVLNGYVNVDDTYIASRSSSDLPAFIQFGSAPEVYYYENGQLHYVNYATYQAYGSPAVGVLSSSFKLLFNIGSDATTTLRNYSDGSVYSSQSGARRYVVGPDAFNYYNLSSTPLSPATSTVLSDVPEGAPLAKPGVIAYANDSNYAGVVSEDGNHLYPISPDLKASLQLPAYTTSTKLIQLLPEASSPITALSKDTTGNLFIIDQNFKLPISSAQQSSLGFDNTAYTAAPDLLLNQLQLHTASQGNQLIFEPGGSPNIYLANAKQLVLFQTPTDLTSSGYSFSDTLILTKRFLDTYFTNNGAVVLPSGVVVRANNSQSVYLIGLNGAKIPIPTSYLFTNTGFSFSWVRVVSQASLDRLATQPTLSPYAVDSSGQRWLLYNGTKRLIPASYQADYNLPSPDSNTQITPWQLDSIPRTYNASDFVRVDNSTNVYLIQQGSSHLLSPSSYLSLTTNPWNDITPVSSDLFSLIPSGSPQL